MAPAASIELWFQDEMRVGQKNGLLYQWAKKGTRPRQPRDQRYENAYLFGAFCADRDAGVALILPRADTAAMQMHIDAIGGAVRPGAHALVLIDKAGLAHDEKAQTSEQPYALASAVCISGAQSGRKHLGVPAQQLSLGPGVQHLY